MAWQAELYPIQETTTPNDTFDITVLFTEKDFGKEFQRSYNFHKEMLQTKEMLLDFIGKEISLLDVMYAVKLELEPIIGKKIELSDKGEVILIENIK